MTSSPSAQSPVPSAAGPDAGALGGRADVTGTRISASVLDAAMVRALELARAAGESGEVPVGAVVLSPDGTALAQAANAREAEHDPTAHAEIRALRAAGAALGDSHLDGCTLVVTLEPCTMCAGAIVLARVARLVLGAWEPRTGACGSVRDVVRDARANHRVEVRAGLRAQESQDLLGAFFADRR
ncbi:nucleoside deaminase [Actinomyces viscosus]|uniref:nucleoside deaminase n=1 Tax=Actinomyces viscosus TaxID=1656 RepID=UPI0018D58148|nr:nucleoside deaminase [Actinomyces viscosus]